MTVKRALFPAALLLGAGVLAGCSLGGPSPEEAAAATVNALGEGDAETWCSNQIMFDENDEVILFDDWDQQDKDNCYSFIASVHTGDLAENNANRYEEMAAAEPGDFELDEEREGYLLMKTENNLEALLVEYDGQYYRPHSSTEHPWAEEWTAG